MKITPLFPKALGETHLLPLPKDSQFLKGVEFQSAHQAEGPTSMEMSKDVRVLNSLPHLKKEIEVSVAEYQNKVWGEKTCTYQITTSWVTRGRPNTFSDVHRHSNCVGAGVWFFDDYAPNTGRLTFLNPDANTDLWIFRENETNYNSMDHVVFPEKGKLILFPNNFFHYVSINESLTARHSLAFNFMVTGSVGARANQILIESVT